MVINSDSRNANLSATNGIPPDRDEPIVDYDGPPAPEADASGYKIREQPYGTRRKVRVVIMGAGASSLNFFKKAEDEMHNLDITCYEKNNDIGGTWLENRYPGKSSCLMWVAYAKTYIPMACFLPPAVLIADNS
jgi:hypothetical protein